MQDQNLLQTACTPFAGGISPNGYGKKWDKKRKQVRSAHVLAWEEANGKEVSKGQVVMHRCDYRACVNPDHLEIGTQSVNLVDAAKRKRLTQARLTKEQVEELRKSDRSAYVLSKEFGVSYTAAKDAKRGRTWKWVTRA